jgi:hypothetical protein
MTQAAATITHPLTTFVLESLHTGKPFMKVYNIIRYTGRFAARI